MVHRKGKGSLESLHFSGNRGTGGPFSLPLFHIGIHTVGRHFQRPNIPEEDLNMFQMGL